MATRAVKNAIDLETGNAVFLKGHAQATYMSTGENVETAINNLKNDIAAGGGIPIVTFNSTSVSLQPNKYYKLTAGKSSLTITLASSSNSSVVNEYFIEFPCSGTVSFPNTVKWKDGVTPTFTSGKTYNVSIINSLGIVAEF